MPGLTALLNCVSRRGMFSHKKASKIQFGVSLNQSFVGDELAEPMRDILIYIAREGVSVINLFRRPGNPKETKELIDYMQQGRPFDVTTFSFYALANVVKKYLLQMPGGVFGASNEQLLLKCLDIADEQERIETMSAVLASLTPVCKQLTAFLFGIWFRMVYHTEVNGMSLEAIAKSVTGSIFHTCNDDPKKVEHASKCMELLIGNFSSAALFSAELIEYFTQQTKTNISRTEKYCYEFVYPAAVDPSQIESFLRDILAEESSKHGFDYDKDMVSAEEFHGGVLPGPVEVDNCCNTTALAGNSQIAAHSSVVSNAVSQVSHSNSNSNSNANLNASVNCNSMVKSNSNANCNTSGNESLTGSTPTGSAPAPADGVPARRQASIERSRTSVGAVPQFAGPVGTRTSRIDIGIGQDLALRRSKTEYGASVKPVRSTLSSPFNGDAQQMSDSDHSRSLEQDDSRRNQLETVDEARLHDRQVAEQRFQSVRQLQLNRLVHRHEWFQNAGAAAGVGVPGSELPVHNSMPVTPTTEPETESNSRADELTAHRQSSKAGASVERSGSVLSGPPVLGLRTAVLPSETDTLVDKSPELATASIAIDSTAEDALRRTVAQIPGSETTTVNGECFIKIARYFIVERHYGPDCEQSVQFYQSHFGRSAPQQLSINRHGQEPTKLTTVTEVEVAD